MLLNHYDYVSIDDVGGKEVTILGGDGGTILREGEGETVFRGCEREKVFRGGELRAGDGELFLRGGDSWAIV